MADSDMIAAAIECACDTAKFIDAGWTQAEGVIAMALLLVSAAGRERAHKLIDLAHKAKEESNGQGSD